MYDSEPFGQDLKSTGERGTVQKFFEARGLSGGPPKAAECVPWPAKLAAPAAHVLGRAIADLPLVELAPADRDRPWPRTLVAVLPAGNAWTAAVARERAAGRLREALLLCRVATDTAWFAALARWPRCYLRGRIRFPGFAGESPWASMVVYVPPPGEDGRRFARAFESLGVIEGAASGGEPSPGSDKQGETRESRSEKNFPATLKKSVTISRVVSYLRRVVGVR